MLIGIPVCYIKAKCYESPFRSWSRGLCVIKIPFVFEVGMMCVYLELTQVYIHHSRQAHKAHTNDTEKRATEQYSIANGTKLKKNDATLGSY